MYERIILKNILNLILLVVIFSSCINSAKNNKKESETKYTRIKNNNYETIIFEESDFKNIRDFEYQIRLAFYKDVEQNRNEAKWKFIKGFNDARIHKDNVVLKSELLKKTDLPYDEFKSEFDRKIVVYDANGLILHLSSVIECAKRPEFDGGYLFGYLFFKKIDILRRLNLKTLDKAQIVNRIYLYFLDRCLYELPLENIQVDDKLLNENRFDNARKTLDEISLIKNGVKFRKLIEKDLDDLIANCGR